MFNRKQLERLFSLCNDNEELRNALKDFCNTVYEDLGEINRNVRNELAILSGSSKILREHNENLESQHQWQELRKNYSQLSSLLETYERYRSGFLLEYSYVNMDELCQKIASTFEVTAISNHISFSYENKMKEPDTLANYVCDVYKMQEAIMYLLKHVFAYISSVSYIKLELQDYSETHFCVYVERDGVEISPETLQSLDRQDLSQETFLRYNGFLNAQKFIHSSKGTLTIKSSPEKTSCIILFPYRFE